MSKEVKEVVNESGTILVLDSNVSGSDLSKILNEEKSEAQILAGRLEKAKKLRQKMQDEENEAQRLADLKVAQMREEKRKKQLAIDLANENALLALLEAEETKIAEAEAREKEKNDSISKLNESIKRVESNLNKLGYKTKILPLLNVLSNYQIELNNLINPAKVETSSKKSDKKTDSAKKVENFKEDSVFYLIQKVIRESESNGIDKKELFNKVLELKVNVSDKTADSIKWSISQLAKKTDFAFNVVNGRYFAK